MSDEKGQNTAPATPTFPASSSFSYGTVTPVKIEVKDVSGKTVDIDTKTAVSGTGSPGTFTVQPLAPKSITYKPNYASRPKMPVGGEVKKGPTTAELEELRLKAELHAELTKIGLDLKDMVHEAGELKKKKLKPESIAFLESAEDKVNNAFAEAYGEPTREKLDSVSELKAEFIEAIEKAGEEAAALPPEIDKEKELQKDILQLSSKIIKATQEGKTLEDRVWDQAILDTFRKSRLDLESELVTLAGKPDESKKDKLEKNLGFYRANISTIEDWIREHPQAPAKAPTLDASFSKAQEQWRFSNLPGERRKDAGRVFNKYLSLIQKARKAGELAVCDAVIKRKFEIEELIRMRDFRKDKRAYADFDISSTLSTFEILIEDVGDELEKALKENGENKKLEDARKNLIKKAEELPKGEYKKQMGRISDGGATDLTLGYLNKQVDGLASHAKKLEKTAGTLKLDEVQSASQDLEEKKGEVETLLKDEEKKRLTINNGLVLRPIKLTNRTKNMVFTNGKTGQDIHNEQDLIKGLEEKKRQEAKKEEAEMIPQMRERYERAYDADPQEFISNYTYTRTLEDGTLRYVMNKRLMEHPYKNIIADILVDPDKEYHLDSLTEPDQVDTLISKAFDQQTKTENEMDRRSMYSPAQDPYVRKNNPLAKPFLPQTEEEKAAYVEQIKGGENPHMTLDAKHYQAESMASIEPVQMAIPNETEPKEKVRVVEQLMKTFKSPRFGIIAAASIVAAVTAGKLTEGPTAPQAPETYAETLEKKDWKTSFVEELSKRDPRFMEFAKLPDDLPNKSPEDIIKKYVPTFFTRESSPARVKMALGMWGNLVQNDNTVHYTNLLPEERKKFSDFRTVLGIISILTSGEDLKTNTNFEQEIMEVKQKSAQKDL